MPAPSEPDKQFHLSGLSRPGPSRLIGKLKLRHMIGWVIVTEQSLAAGDAVRKMSDFVVVVEVGYLMGFELP
jgi:hypothetical protein